MPASSSRRLVTTGSLTLALALATPLAAFADPSLAPKEDAGAKGQSTAAAARSGEQGASADVRQDEHAPAAAPQREEQDEDEAGTEEQAAPTQGSTTSAAKKDAAPKSAQAEDVEAKKADKTEKAPKAKDDAETPRGDGTSGNPGVGDEAQGERKVTICHATSSATNPYVQITVSKAAVLNGHADHQDDGDIIPSFRYVDSDGSTQTFPAQGDQSILAAGCETGTTGGNDGGAGSGDGNEGDGGNDGGAGGGAGGGGDEDADERKVTICHATGSETNPYVQITIAKSAVVNGHADHQDGEDIIPMFTYLDMNNIETVFPAQGDQSLLDSGCEVDGETDGGTDGGTDGNGSVDNGDNGDNGGNGGNGGNGTDTGTGTDVELPVAGGDTSGGSKENPIVPPSLGGGAGTVDSPDTTVETPGTTVTPEVDVQPIRDTTTDAGSGEGVVVANGQGTTTVVQARGAAAPQQLPFTGGSVGALIALGLGALGAGGLANRMGRSPRAEHAVS